MIRGHLSCPPGCTGPGPELHGPSVPGMGPKYEKEAHLKFLGWPPFCPPAPPKEPIFIPQNLLDVCPCHLALY